MRSDAITEPPGESTLKITAFTFLSRLISFTDSLTFLATSSVIVLLIRITAIFSSSDAAFLGLNFGCGLERELLG
jgi:hypothetical protein